MSTFQIVQFDVLSLQTVLAECRRLNIDDYRSVAVAFNHWSRDFARKAYLFYRAQYLQHYNKIWEPFCAAHNLQSGDALPEWLERVWLMRREDEGLCEHQRFVDSQRMMLEQFDVKLLSDSFANAGGVLRAVPMNFDALWFNTTIRQPLEQQAALRGLPYDAYLTTRHWRKVRGAMLLLHQGMCQGENCPSSGESWYGDEPLVQVHHVRYDNLGNERYGDLKLLCKDCHEAVHVR